MRGENLWMEKAKFICFWRLLLSVCLPGLILIKLALKIYNAEQQSTNFPKI